MRKFYLATALVASAGIAAVAPAQAQTTVNFDQSVDPTSYAAQGLVLNGFSISANTYGGAVIIPTAPNYASVNSSASTISFVDSLGQATTSNGFALTTVGLNAGNGFYNGATLTFLDAMGATLGTQTFAPVGPNAARSPIDYSNDYAGIATISFLLQQNSSGPGLFALDSVSFTPNAVSAAVPEPATWGMMILGMGAVGYAMRRRQKVATKVSYAA